MKTELPPPFRPDLPLVESSGTYVKTIPSSPRSWTWLIVAVSLVASFVLGYAAKPQGAPTVRSPQSCITALDEADKDFAVAADAVRALQAGDGQGAIALLDGIDVDAYLNAKGECRGTV
jgi:hypothetical protein